jgi:hypothetical protein
MKKIVLFFTFFIVIDFSCTAQAPTWSADVANIIYSKCSSCHHSGTIAPFSLMSYTDAVGNASAISADVTNHIMPPWPPDANYKHFIHERVLTTTEINTIVNWVSGGTPIGSAAASPVPPVFSTGFLIPSPDLIMQMPTYQSTATSADLFRCFVLPTGITSDKYVEQIEVIPGNRSIVHHIIIFTDNGTICTALDAADSLPGYASFGGTGDHYSKHIGSWTPGEGKIELPTGFGFKLPANTNIILQIHYTAGSSGQSDSTKIRIKYSSLPSPRVIHLDVPLDNFNTTLIDGPLAIPANSLKTFHEVDTIPVSISIFSIQPHMHYVGRTIDCYGVTPLGDTIRMIKIDDWKFHWQGQYNFTHPVVIPAGTVLYSEAFYDNTPANTENPAGGLQPIAAGADSDHEMMMTAFNYTGYMPGDENINVDSMLTLGVSTIDSKVNSLFIYPNPSHDKIYFRSTNENIPLRAELYNLLGELVIEEQKGNEMDISGLPSGIYFVRIKQNDLVLSQKIIKN